MRRIGFGLRPRLVLALVLTAAVTLGAAALALLSPLQERLSNQSERDLQAAVLSARQSMADQLRRDRGRVSDEVQRLARGLARRTSARVIVTDGIPTTVRPYLYDTANPGTPDNQGDILSALRTRSTQVGSAGDATRIATPLDVPGGRTFVLAARRTADDAAGVVDEVRSAFAKAALIALAAAVVLGLALVTTILRRLELLRATARRIMTEGPEEAPTPVDRGSDEVGDLARTLAGMQEALRRQERARRAFVSTASHELRTPLTSLGGTLELLQEDLRDERIDLADAQEQLALAQGQVGRLQHLASDLLDLSRLDAAIPLRSEPVELGEVCRAVGAEFAGQAAKEDVALETAEPIGPCWARGDPTAVARIVRILLDNALRLAPPGTTVAVTPAYRGPEATVEVIDAGPGVPAADSERIFERFQSGSAVSAPGGSGLGLAIGRELALRLGGRLELVASNGGPGARFVLTLPIEMPAGTARDARTAGV